MRDTMLRQQRDFALFHSYQEALKEKSFKTQRDAIAYLLSSEAPQWFVSQEFCAAVISCRLRGKDHYKMSKTRRRKFDALFDLYKQLRTDPRYDGLNHLELCGVIVQMPAPEWFLHYDAAALILLRQRKLINEKMVRRYGRK